MYQMSNRVLMGVLQMCNCQSWGSVTVLSVCDLLCNVKPKPNEVKKTVTVFKLGWFIRYHCIDTITF